MLFFFWLSLVGFAYRAHANPVFGNPVPMLQSAAAEKSHVFKSTAGYLYSVSVAPSNTAGFLLLYDATTAPSDGSVTPVACYDVPSSTAVTENYAWPFPFPRRHRRGIQHDRLFHADRQQRLPFSADKMKKLPALILAAILGIAAAAQAQTYINTNLPVPATGSTSLQPGDTVVADRGGVTYGLFFGPISLSAFGSSYTDGQLLIGSTPLDT